MGADASRETQVYHAASVGKMFTAVAIARLIEAKNKLGHPNYLHLARTTPKKFIHLEGAGA